MSSTNKLSQKIKRTIPSAIRLLTRTLPAKAEVFVVGGAVRDALIRKKTKDFDVVVRNIAATTIQKILRSTGAVELVGKNFGVFKWTPRRWQGEQIDVALPRVDHSFGTGGYKDVKTQSNPKLSLQEDVCRRDFTVNALAFDVKKNTLIDHVGGLSDLASKRLQTVGDPVKRFREDYTRLLRGVRFSVQLGFHLEARTAKILRIIMHHVNDKDKKGEWKVPRETVAHELIRMFTVDPVRAFDASYFSHLFDELMPELIDLQGCPQPQQYHVEGDVMQHTRLALEQLATPTYKKLFGKAQPSALLIFSILFHDIGKPAVITFPEFEREDRIRYNNHDVVGAEMTSLRAQELHLSIFSREDTRKHIDIDKLAWLVRNHLIGFRNGIKEMKPATIEKYYFNQYYPSEELLRLQYVDSAATIGKKGKPDLSGFRAIYQTVKKISQARKGSGVKPLLTGTDIMTTLNMPSGPDIGKILTQLRNAQLQGKVRTQRAALDFIKKQ